MDVRPADTADLTAIRDLQIANWQGAYRGMVSDAFLERDVPEILARKWAELPGSDNLVLTAWDDDLAGFVAVERSRPGGPYVDNLHVAEVARGRGIGRALMAEAARILSAEGSRTLWLTVIRENAPTRAFYRGIGGIEGPEQKDFLYGQGIVSLPVRWDDLSALAALR